MCTRTSRSPAFRGIVTCEDWPADPKLDSIEVDDSWVDILRQRLKRARSRLSEHDVRYLGLQIVQSPGVSSQWL